MPPECEAYGARWGTDGLLYLCEWRRGFIVHELRSMFYDCQQSAPSATRTGDSSETSTI